jgi:foldase protein PrsA
MRTAVACAAAIATAVGVGACGTSVPSSAIAVVGGYNVPKTAFNHWLTVANNQPYIGTGTTPPAVPLPPSYTACIAGERARVAKGSTAPATSVLRSECAASYKELAEEVTALLVEGVWFQGEAYDRHVHVTQKAINAAWNEERVAQFPTTTKLNTFLAESGYTIADLKWVAMLNLLQEDIVKKIDAQASHVGAAAIAAYYKAHISQYSQPERRDIELVLTKTAATAATAKSAISGGTSFASVAKQYSIDPTTKSTGGVEDGVEQGEETPTLSTAIFNAPIGTLEGPLKTAFGYYVFEVTKSIPKSVESLASETTTIKDQLVSAAQTAAVDKLRNSFVKKWQARTTCGSAYLVTQVCGNAPAAASTGASGTTSTSGASGSS